MLEDDAIAVMRGGGARQRRFATPDPNAGLAAPDGVAYQPVQSVDESLAAVGADRKVALALELEARVRAADERIVGHEGADYADVRAVTAVASTTGLRRAEEETLAHTGIWALASDGDEVTTGFGLSCARGFDGLDVGAVVAEAVQRSTSLLGARKADSERITVVFDPYVTSQFLGHRRGDALR